MNAIHYSLAAFPRKSFLDAMGMAASGHFKDPGIAAMSINHVQLCPQNLGRLDEGVVDDLLRLYPATRFRLHANVFVIESRVISDLSDAKGNERYWRRMASLSGRLNADGYSAHAGRRSNNTLQGVIDNAKWATELFGLPVAIEGHYPDRKEPWLFSTWEEYRFLLDAKVPYALDMSHLNIVARNGRDYQRTLVQEMLSSEYCLEVHISGNDGRRDIHEPILQQPYWWPDMAYANPLAIVFSEGQFRTNS